MFQNKLRNFVLSLVTFFLVSVFSFSIVHLAPGDPVEVMYGDQALTKEDYQKIKKSLGLDKPLVEQYFIFMSDIFEGDFGSSFLTQEPVLKEFLSLLPATIELTALAIIIAIFFGVLFGIYAARNRGKPLDYIFMSGALIGYSMPIFWLGLLFILFFSVNLGLFPVSGRMGFMFEVEPVTGFLLIDSLLSEDGVSAFLDALYHIIIPASVLSTISLSSIARVTRHSLVHIMNEDYIRTARAKGVSKNVIFFKHALKNAYIPIVTVIGVGIGALVTGSIVTEILFSWPGVGRWMVSSVESRDYPSVRGGLLLISIIVIVINFLIDLLYGAIDSRVKS